MAESIRFWIDRIMTPIGELALAADEAGALRAVDWTEHTNRTERLLRLRYGLHLVLEPRRDPYSLTAALRAYFAGELTIIDQLPVAASGTIFQRAVWAALRTIPCGTTISYGTLAMRLGKPAAVRAVGLANGANPVGIVVPCHRVIGANGALTGYGGGLTRKRWLLQHEGALIGKESNLFEEELAP
jgi:methylated-DNA-[protein]-cysteine S-methyltransferase